MRDRFHRAAIKSVIALQPGPGGLAQNDETLCLPGHSLDDLSLTWRRIGEDGVQDHQSRLPQILENVEDGNPVASAVDAELVLQNDEIGIGRRNQA